MSPPRAFPINEIFETIQGEATHAGRPSVFLRTQGCGVGCPWCDTKHTWDADPAEETDSVSLIADKPASTARWAMLSHETIIANLIAYDASHIVITGGEPCLHDLTDLTTLLIEQHGRTVQIETSGTQPVRAHPDTWVTVSPKLAMPGGFAVRPDAMARANEIKMPVGKPADLETLHGLLLQFHVRAETPIWLQPLSMNARATALCKDAAIANNWRISLQLHAYAGWR